MCFYFFLFHLKNGIRRCQIHYSFGFNNCFCTLETGLNVVSHFVLIVMPLMVWINHKKNRITRMGITQDVTIMMAVASMKLFNDLLNVFVYFCAVEENASAAFPKKFLFSLSWYIFLDVVRVINRFLNTCFIGGFNCFR